VKEEEGKGVELASLCAVRYLFLVRGGQRRVLDLVTWGLQASVNSLVGALMLKSARGLHAKLEL
jgi:hypothetical protein